MKKLFLLALFVATVANGGFLDSVVGSASKILNTTTQNRSLIDEVKSQTGLSTTQTTSTLGTLLGYAQNNLSSSDYSSITNKVPALNSLTSNPTVAPLLGSLKSASMVQNALQGFGVNPSIIQKVIPIVVQYVSKSGGASSGDKLLNAFSGLMK